MLNVNTRHVQRFYFGCVLHSGSSGSLTRRRGVTSFVCSKRHNDIHRSRGTDWLSVCGLGESLIVTSQSLRDGRFPSMPVSEQRRPWSVKAHGRPGRHVGAAGSGWERNALCPSPRPCLSPRGRAAGWGGEATGKRLEVWSHGRRSQHGHCLTQWKFCEPDLPHVQTRLCLSASVSTTLSLLRLWKWSLA